ncbi:DUF4395 domain-containing protein [Piscinibacter sp.]|uniref:DUF4395 domain-containing protein n=1 Tax=Piscinibacter sp. TaxID=1903157 RepID=UPI003784A7EE
MPHSATASTPLYGQALYGQSPEGTPLTAGVFNEHEVRAAAGVTMALGTAAFVFAYFAKVYLPIQVVTTLLFVEFLVRVLAGFQYSPVRWAVRWMTRRRAPEWASAKPKRFAWSLGLVMAFAMMIITNSGIRGTLPLTICLLCITLMWLESVLGMCVGCELHGFLVRRGWAKKDPAYEVCAHGACTIGTRRGAGS